jgi:hypothetical protein
MKLSRNTATLLKFAVLGLILSIRCFTWAQSILMCLFVTWVYPYIVAWFYGVHAMPSMDRLCFIAKDTARINFISVTTVDRYEYELAKKRALTFIKTKDKLRWSVVEIFGDLYWKDNKDVEKVADITVRKCPCDFANERELE